MGKREYVSLARRNPVHILEASHSDFFYSEGDAFCLTAELEPYLDNPVFARHYLDVIEYRTRRYYKERLEKRMEEILRDGGA